MEVTQDYPSTHASAGLTYSFNDANQKLGTGYHQDDNGRIDAYRTYYSGRFDSGEVIRRYSYDRRGWLKDFADEQYSGGTPGDCPNNGFIDPEGGECVPPRGSVSTVLGGRSYAYDAVGNRTDSTNVDWGNRMTGFRNYQLTYDDDGNLTRKLVPGYDDLAPTWNSLGEMTGAWRYQKGTVQYGYDAGGRRVRRTAPNGTMTWYLYDGDDLLMEIDGAGNPIREYTYYPGVDRPHSVRTGGQTYYYAMEEPGHVMGLIDSSNQVVNKYGYTPWGETDVALEGVSQPLGYMAREYDAVTGLYNVRARWYDPHQGRFVSEDPIGLGGGINPYAYAGNSPTNYTDPTGLCYLGRGDMGYGGHKGQGTYFETEACPALESPSAFMDDLLEWVRRKTSGGLASPTRGGSLQGAVHTFLQQVPTLEDFYANGESAESRAARHRKNRICSMQAAGFILNATLDVSGVGAAGYAMYTGAKLLPALGVGLTTRIYGPSVTTPLPPAVTPTSVSFATGALDHGERYNGEDFWNSIQGVVPVWGSMLAWDSMQRACN